MSLSLKLVNYFHKTLNLKTYGISPSAILQFPALWQTGKPCNKKTNFPEVFGELSGYFPG
jgi:hypothetical protein